MSSSADRLVAAADRLRRALAPLCFGPPVTHVYNPLEYAWAPHEAYLRRFGAGRKRVLFLGMNPGPFGMAQTGIPFGEVAAVRNWIGIEAAVGRPVPEHVKRPVEGFGCRRSEVSGRRLWGWARDTFGTADAFFAGHFVVNYCPLIFLEESGRNRTPEKIPASEIAPVEAACQEHLSEVIDLLDPEWLVGVGGFAEARLQRVADGRRVTRIPHPSPANPAANRNWAAAATGALRKAGIL